MLLEDMGFLVHGISILSEDLSLLSVIKTPPTEVLYTTKLVLIMVELVYPPV